MSAVSFAEMNTLQIVSVAVIAVAALFAAWRSARAEPSRVWRWALPALQLTAALAFGLLLFPPSSALRLDALTVLTPGASAAQRASLPLAQVVVALPGAEAPASAERVPDLATALRRHPAARAIDVVGAGLPPRDLPLPAGLGLRFEQTPAQGLIELDAAAAAPVGAQWTLRGRVAGRAAQLQLRDVSGAVVDRMAVGRDGGFALSTVGRAAGPALFQLQALDTEQAVVDSAHVPVVFRSGAALRLLLRAAGPDPDQKYWRRWAADAGASVAATIGLSDGLALHAGDAAINAATLAAADLVVLDERSWAALAADEKSALLAAVDQGLGLLLRVTGAVDPAVAAEWATQLGLPALLPQQATRGVSLARMLALREPLPLSAAPARFAPGAQSLLSADDGDTLAAWSARGQGRIGAVLLIDSFKLTLQGESGRYGALWGGLVGQLARPRAQAQAPPLPLQAWVDERQTLCGLSADAQLTGPDQQPQPLLIENGCAAVWPANAGWYRLILAGANWPFYVHAADDASGLRAARDGAAAQALVADAGDLLPAAVPTPQSKVPIPRWPLLLAWLLLTAPIWWRERRSLQAG